MDHKGIFVQKLEVIEVNEQDVMDIIVRLD